MKTKASFSFLSGSYLKERIVLIMTNSYDKTLQAFFKFLLPLGLLLPFLEKKKKKRCCFIDLIRGFHPIRIRVSGVICCLQHLYCAGFGPGLSCMIQDQDTVCECTTLNTRLYETETVCGLGGLRAGGRNDHNDARALMAKKKTV